MTKKKTKKLEHCTIPKPKTKHLLFLNVLTDINVCILPLSLCAVTLNRPIFYDCILNKIIIPNCISRGLHRSTKTRLRTVGSVTANIRHDFIMNFSYTMFTF